MKYKFLNLISIFFLVICSLSISFAHSDGVGEEKVQSQSSTLLPFHYFSEGSYFQGIFIIVFWGLLAKGVYELSIMVLGRAFLEEESKK